MIALEVRFYQSSRLTSEVQRDLIRFAHTENYIYLSFAYSVRLSHGASEASR
jgi:hypothetical protein